MSPGATHAAQQWLRTAADGLIAAVLAPACAACHAALERPLDGAVCAGCWAAILPFPPPLCERCGDPLASWRRPQTDAPTCVRCRRWPQAITAARAIGPYDGSLRSIVQALKYGCRRSVAAPLAARMREAAGPLTAAADIAVPVPLHRRRRRQRGFNQAEELARALGIPVRLALRRVRATASQTGLSAGERESNVRGAFAIESRAPVRGCRVVLVDDVRTTGATVAACAAVLLGAGAQEVSVLTAASVPAGSPEP